MVEQAPKSAVLTDPVAKSAGGSGENLRKIVRIPLRAMKLIYIIASYEINDPLLFQKGGC